MSLKEQVTLDQSGKVASGESFTKYEAGEFDGDGDVQKPASAGNKIEGVVPLRVDEDERTRLIMQGIFPVKIGDSTPGNVTAGTDLAVMTDGHFQSATSAGTGDEIQAVALEAAGSTGDIIMAYVDKFIDRQAP